MKLNSYRQNYEIISFERICILQSNCKFQVNELKQTVNESAETITSLKKTTLIMLGIIMFLQLLLAYQVMSLNSESGNVTNSGDIINHQETHISDEKQEL